MEANRVGSSSPLSSIGDEPPSSPPPAAKSPPTAVTACQDAPPSSSPARKSRAISSRKRPAKKPAAKPVPKKSKWDAENILTDHKSPLASADLRSLLSSPMAWDALDADDKAEILALFPDQTHIITPGTETARPDLSALMNDDTFRHDCATYTEHVVQGRFDPEWLACAWTAHERRKIGDFDEHLNNKFEEDWQVDLPEDFKTKRALPSAEEKENGGEDRVADSKGTGENPTRFGKSEEKEEGEKIDDHLDHIHDGSATRVEGDHEEQGGQTQKDAHNMVLDELQAGDGSDNAHSRPIVRRQSTRMDIDGAESEDELA